MTSIPLLDRSAVVYYSIVDKTDWSFLWFCEMNRLLHLTDCSVDVPPPILFSALQVITRMAVADPDPVQQQALNAVPSLPEARQRQENYRRARGFQRLSPALMKKPEMVELLQGVEEIKKVCFQFSASIDGVDVFKFSSTSNSSYFLSIFSENMVRRLVPSDLDAFFLIIVPCSASEQIAQEREEEANKDTYHDARTDSAVIPCNSRVEDTLRYITYDLRQAVPGKKMANMMFHSILEAVFPIIKEQGRKGLPIRIGRTLYHAK